jgi:hypothetical protein
LALSVVSSALNGFLAWVMFAAAKQHRSIALEADAKHLVTDVWTSVGVVVGIIGVALTGWLWLDALVAIGVAINIMWEGYQLIWRSSQGLMDEAVEPEVLAEMQDEPEDEENDIEGIIMLAKGMPTLPPEGLSLKERMAQIERSIIEQALTRNSGNVSRTAKLLNLQRTTLIEKINKYELRSVA